MLNLTNEELESLYGILITEEQELKDLIETVGNESDEKELSVELKRVQSIISKVKEIRK